MKRGAQLSTVLFCSLAVLGCASPPQQNAGIDDVRRWTASHVGEPVEWRGHTIEDARAQAAVDQLLAQPLTVDSSVQIALLNNRSLQAVLEDLAVSQADLVQAGLLHNPIFAASFRLPDRPPNGTDTELSVEQDFLDLLVLPLRRKVAAAEFERSKLMVSDHVMQLADDVKVVVYTMQARQQLLERLRQIADGDQTAAMLSRRQFDAGTLNELGLANQQVAASQARLQVSMAQQQLVSDREQLNRLMGIGPTQIGWRLDPRLSQLPAQEPAIAELQAVAIQQRPDLAAARLEIASLTEAVSISRGFRYFTAVDFGVDTERTPDGQRVIGPTLSLQIPIFDQGQARIGRADALLRAAQDRYMAAAVDAASEVREASARLILLRSIAGSANEVLQQRRRILDLMLQQYNGMLKGPYDLLVARQAEVDAERGSIETLRDYWIARVALERAVGGRLQERPQTQPAGVER